MNTKTWYAVIILLLATGLFYECKKDEKSNPTPKEDPTPEPEETPYMTLIGRGEGGLLRLKLNAAHQDRKDCWIDMNGNGVKDIAEDDISFGYFKNYPRPDNQVIIYGKITLLHAPSEAHLEDINTRKNPYLEELDCSDNKLTTLNMSSNSHLKVLKCNRSETFYVNLHSNTSLEVLELNDNKLTKLDVSKNTKLKKLDIRDNHLKTIDLSNNIQLDTLYCSDNKFRTLDVSQNTELKILEFGGKFSYLEHLDLRNNKKLKKITGRWARESIESINLANGNTDKLERVDLHDCNDLTCIQVDDGFNIHNTSGVWYLPYDSEISYTPCN